MLQILVKLAASVVVILLASQIAKRVPSLGGLIAVMPLTGLIVLLWLYSAEPGNYEAMVGYCKGAMWGILPSILFFAAAHYCFSQRYSLGTVLMVSFGIWVVGAAVHQFFLR